MSEPLRVERHGPVTVVTIDRPRRRNAVDRPTADGLLAAFAEGTVVFFGASFVTIALDEQLDVRI